MIRPGDKICVAVSGGKDSLTLLEILANLRKVYDNTFSLEAITVNLGYEESDFSHINRFCEKLNINYTVVDTQIAKIVFEERQEKNPCSLCAKMRRGALNAKAKELGCTRIALGHHKEDVIETVFMSMFFEARYYCFPPVTYMEQTQLYAIRPLIYTSEKDIRNYAKTVTLPVLESPCPANGNTNREHMKQLLKEQSSLFPGLPNRLFKALQRSSVDGWNMEGER